MENVLNRYRNTTVLVAVLFVQIIGLAVQVKKPTQAGPMRLIRYWAVSAITPLERAVVGTGHGIRNFWSNYAYLRGVRQENRDLKQQIEQMRMEEVRMKQDAEQAQRLQALLGFKEKFISETVAAQVIGTSGSEQSRILYIDKGASDGVKTDMAVVTPDGIVGKVLQTTSHSATVLEIGDRSSGVGGILEKSRLQGIVKGSAAGELSLLYVMSDEKVEPGERVLTSGGDRIFPKGIPVGSVTNVSPGRDLFLNIRVKPAAELGRLEEVLVITKIVEKESEGAVAEGPVRAADILAQRLPTVEKKAPAPTPTPGTPASKPPAAPATATPKPAVANAQVAKPVPTQTPKLKRTPTPSQSQPAPTPTNEGAPQ